MKMVEDIMRAIIDGLMPRSEVGCIMSHLAWCMAYEGRC